MLKKELISYTIDALQKNTGNAYSLDELRRLGVFEEIDVIDGNEVVIKKSLARIIHQILVLILHEEEATKWGAALELKDIYDCHACVRHIAQVYVKGIMDGSDKEYFGNDDEASKQDVEEYFTRLFEKERRKEIVSVATSFHVVSLDEAAAIMNEKKVHAIDVRYDVDENYRGFMHFPLNKLMLNPHGVCENKTDYIIIRCKSGYLASIAGKLLVDYGYKNVYVII